jgi:hypothetical protein
MLLPLLGFIIGVTAFAVLGTAALRLQGEWPPRLIHLAVFIAVAMVAALIWGWVFGAAFASSSGQLESTFAVIVLLLGIPICGSLAGWLAVRRLSRGG